MHPTTKGAAAVTDEGTALPVVHVMLSTTAGATTTRRSQAATYGLVFGEPPPRRRSAERVADGGGATPRRRAERPVASDSHRPHGTHVKYVVECCGCEACREANRDYERRRGRAIARPDEVWIPYVPAGPARRHLAELSKQGVGLKTVSRLSGVSHGALSKMVYGDPRRGQAPSRRVRPETLAAILAVRLHQAQGGQKVPAGPTWALLEELLAAGYTKVFLARALGSTAANPALQVSRDRVRASTARAVEALHARLIRQQPPPRRSRWSR
jgi:hypothetical protein